MLAGSALVRSQLHNPNAVLAPSEAVKLYNAMLQRSKQQDSDSDVLAGLHPAEYFAGNQDAALKTFVTQAHARAWAADLMARADATPGFASAAADELLQPAAGKLAQLAAAADELNQKAQIGKAYTMHTFAKSNALALLLQLDACEKLPAICFNHNRAGCEKHVLHIMQVLDDQMAQETGLGFEDREARREELQESIEVLSWMQSAA